MNPPILSRRAPTLRRSLQETRPGIRAHHA
jgi:hypothetical protein